MKILFTVTVTSFDAAAKLEKILDSAGYKYAADINGQPTGAVKPRGKRVVIGKSELAAVLQCVANHPKWTIIQVAHDTNVSRPTAGRIMKGTHVLQRKAA